MNILFLTLQSISSINKRGIYTDLLRKFRQEGHSVTVVTPMERRMGINTNLRQEEGANILQVRTLNIQKTNMVEKGNLEALIYAINEIKQKGKSNYTEACRNRVLKLYRKEDRYNDYLYLYNELLENNK